MVRQKTTSEKYFRIYNNNRWLRLKRDIWVARYLFRLLILWLTVGGKLRREKERAKNENRVIFIDEVMGGGNT